MPLRRRIGLLSALAVGITVLVAGVITYAVVQSELRGQVDDALRSQAQRTQQLARGGPGRGRDFEGGRGIPMPPPSAGQPIATQIINAAGGVAAVGPDQINQVTIPVTDRDREVAASQQGAYFDERRDGDTKLRVYTFPVGGDGALQLARSLNGVDDVLERLRLVLAAVLLLGTIAGGLLGRLFSSRALRPVADLTDAVEHVELTGDLSPRIVPGGRSESDEVGRLAARFNAMLARLQASRADLDASVDAQRRLVADASHELRTPVTSLRTNAEVLLEQPDMPLAEREALLDDVVAQADELGMLVADLIELARDGERAAVFDREELRLDELVAESVARARRHAPRVTFTARLAPAVVEANPERLARAVNNLLDNAVKHGPEAGPVEVTVTDEGEVRVRDHGPGVPASEREHVFDRFWRGSAARARPGSGLGLAIVQQVALAHGGTVSVQDAPGGGADFRLRLAALGLVGGFGGGGFRHGG